MLFLHEEVKEEEEMSTIEIYFFIILTPRISFRSEILGKNDDVDGNEEEINVAINIMPISMMMII